MNRKKTNLENDKPALSKGDVRRSCDNCSFFHKGLRRNFGELDKSIIGECDNNKVPTRICVSYGMTCSGNYHNFA